MKTANSEGILLSGHTLGTPNETVVDAVRLFASAGLDGAELIWQNDYRSGVPESDNSHVLAELRAVASETGMAIVGLTPYMSGINSLDETVRSRDLERFAACISDAAELGAGIVRVYAGAYTAAEADQHPELWAQLVSSLQELAPLAAAAGVVLAVENHFNTMTMTARETADLVKAVDRDAVGILYDQANLTFTHSEPFEVARDIQAGLVRHVHAKDLVFVDRDRPFSASDVATVTGEQRSVRSRTVGDGEMDWEGIIGTLVEDGYNGAISLEYEYRWHPQDLPEPLEGFTQGATHLRSLIRKASEGMLPARTS